MEGLKEAIEFITNLKEGSMEPKVLDINGNTYCNKNLTRYHYFPKADSLSVNTLTSIVDYIKGKPEELRETMILHVISPTEVSNYQFPRYIDAYSGIVKMLSAVGAKLKIIYNDKDSCVNISAVPISDLSEKYEYSDDYGMKIIIEKKTGGVNHLICLGAGELAARTVIDLYVDKTGAITEKQAYFGEYEIAETYDYGNSESATELKEKGIEHLKELKSSDSVSASFSKLDVDIGDIVGGRNRATGIVLKEPVTQEIVKIKNGIETITYKVGEE